MKRRQAVVRCLLQHSEQLFPDVHSPRHRPPLLDDVNAQGTGAVADASRTDRVSYSTAGQDSPALERALLSHSSNPSQADYSQVLLPSQAGAGNVDRGGSVAPSDTGVSTTKQQQQRQQQQQSPSQQVAANVWSRHGGGGGGSDGDVSFNGDDRPDGQDQPLLPGGGTGRVADGELQPAVVAVAVGSMHAGDDDGDDVDDDHGSGSDHGGHAGGSDGSIHDADVHGNGEGYVSGSDGDDVVERADSNGDHAVVDDDGGGASDGEYSDGGHNHELHHDHSLTDLHVHVADRADDSVHNKRLSTGSRGSGGGSGGGSAATAAVVSSPLAVRVSLHAHGLPSVAPAAALSHSRSPVASADRAMARGGGNSAEAAAVARGGVSSLPRSLHVEGLGSGTSAVRGTSASGTSGTNSGTASSRAHGGSGRAGAGIVSGGGVVVGRGAHAGVGGAVAGTKVGSTVLPARFVNSPYLTGGPGKVSAARAGSSTTGVHGRSGAGSGSGSGSGSGGKVAAGSGGGGKHAATSAVVVVGSGHSDGTVHGSGLAGARYGSASASARHSGGGSGSGGGVSKAAARGGVSSGGTKPQRHTIDAPSTGHTSLKAYVYDELSHRGVAVYVRVAPRGFVGPARFVWVPDWDAMCDVMVSSCPAPGCALYPCHPAVYAPCVV